MKSPIYFLWILISFQSLTAQTLVPKLYANAPIGLNVLFVGYGHTQGAIPENPYVGVTDPNLNINSAFLGYVKTFDVLGHNAKLDVFLPFSSLDGTAQRQGNDVSRDISGIGDTKVRFTFNLFGAPSLSFQEFASYQQDTIVGVSIQANLPTGQYDNSEAINIGTNRWSIKPGIGISKRVADYTFEFAADVEFYSVNNDFHEDFKRKQDPIYSTQINALYTFRRGMWLAIGATYYWGGEIFMDGVETDNDLSNARIGATFTFPVDKKNSIKLFGSRGVNTRYGTDFDSIAIVWQYNWAD